MLGFFRCRRPATANMGGSVASRRLARLSVCLVLAMGISGCADSPTLFPQGEAAPAATASGEVFALRPPLAWRKRRDSVSGRQRVIIYLAPGRTPADWSQMLVYRIVEGHSDRSLGSWLHGTRSILERRCRRASARRLNTSPVNGYPAVLEMQVCRGDRITGKDQVAVMRIVLGQERVYMVQWIRRLKPGAPIPTNSRLERWVARVEASEVCDTRGTSHPCPPWLTGSDR